MFFNRTYFDLLFLLRLLEDFDPWGLLDPGNWIWVAACWATSAEFSRGFLVDVPKMRKWSILQFTKNFMLHLSLVDVFIVRRHELVKREMQSLYWFCAPTQVYSCFLLSAAVGVGEISFHF
jgi:hypothetical protein